MENSKNAYAKSNAHGLTLAQQNAVDLRTAQKLAGHTDPILTGTDEVKADAVVRLGVPPGVPTGGIKQHQMSSFCNNQSTGTSEAMDSQTLEMQADGVNQHRTASICTSGSGGSRTHFQGVMSTLLDR